MSRFVCQSLLSNHCLPAGHSALLTCLSTWLVACLSSLQLRRGFCTKAEAGYYPLWAQKHTYQLATKPNIHEVVGFVVFVVGASTFFVLSEIRSLEKQLYRLDQRVTDNTDAVRSLQLSAEIAEYRARK